MIDDILLDAEDAMEKAVESTRRELAKIRTGKATTALLDGIKIEYYETMVAINQVASIGIPEPRLMVIQPWDKSILPTIEKAILKANIGLTPSNDGNVIRLPIPPLTEETRKDLVKHIKKLAEEGKISIRNSRRDANDKLKKAEKDGKISEDDSKSAQEEIQRLTDKYIEKIDEILDKKEKEIMEV